MYRHGVTIALTVAVLAACTKDHESTTVARRGGDDQPAGLVSNSAPDPAHRAQLSELTFADLAPEQDPLFPECRKTMTSQQLCACLLAQHDDDDDEYSFRECKTDWFRATQEWFITELVENSFQLYFLVRHDERGYTPVATVQFLSPRGDIEETYQAISVSAQMGNGIHIVEVVGAIDSRDPDAPEDDSPPTRDVAICRFDGAEVRACVNLDYTTEYTLRDNGTLEIIASEFGPEPGVYDLLY